MVGEGGDADEAERQPQAQAPGVAGEFGRQITAVQRRTHRIHTTTVTPFSGEVGSAPPGHDAQAASVADQQHTRAERERQSLVRVQCDRVADLCVCMYVGR